MKICPKCSTVIQNPEAQFCYNCGFRLPEETTKKAVENREVENKKEIVQNIEKEGNPKTTKPPVEIRSIAKNEPTTTERIISKSASGKNNVSKKWFNFILGANILAASFLLVSIGLFFRSTQNKKGVNLSPITEINSLEVNAVIFGEEKPENFVLTEEFYNVVPQQPLFYMEGSGLQNLLTNVLSKEDIQYIEETYKTPLNELLTFTSNQFAYVKQDNEKWAVITLPASVDFFERAFSNYQKNKKEDAKIITARIDKYLVFSNSKEYLNDIRSSSDKTLLAINKDSRFTAKVSKTPKNAVFFSYIFSDTYARESFLDDLRLVNLENIYPDIKGSNFKAFAITKNENKFEIVFLD